ncbi:hypothetical protein ACJX0J_040790 [Zea mays]
MYFLYRMWDQRSCVPQFGDANKTENPAQRRAVRDRRHASFAESYLIASDAGDAFSNYKHRTMLMHYDIFFVACLILVHFWSIWTLWLVLVWFLFMFHLEQKVTEQPIYVNFGHIACRDLDT